MNYPLARAVAVVLALVFVGVPWTDAFAQSVDTDPLDRFRDRMIEYRPESFINSAYLLKGGRVIDIGYFGQNAEMHFGESAAALNEMDTYFDFRVAGFTLWLTGIAALTVDFILLLAAEDTVTNENSEGQRSGNGVFWGLFGGGTALSITGNILMVEANTYLNRGIDNYNADLYNASRALAANATPFRGPVFRYSGRF